MKKLTFVVGLVALICCTAVLAADTGGNRPCLVILQQDLQPYANKLKFHEGFAGFLRSLPPEQIVDVFSFSINNVYPVVSGKAGELIWPPKDYDFVANNSNTIPFKALLATLVHRRAADQTVYFISNCRDMDLVQNLHIEGLSSYRHVNIKPSVIQSYQKSYVLDRRDFDPNTYEPLTELARFCSERNVRIVGIFVRTVPLVTLFEDDTWRGTTTFFVGDMRYIQQRDKERNLIIDSAGFTALSWIVEKSGGDLYHDFTSFKGLFQQVGKKNF